MHRNYELELYKLIIRPDEEDGDFSYISELGWVNDTQFCVWVNYLVLDEFIERLKNLLGNGIFDDGGFNGNLQTDCVCIDLCKIVNCDMRVEYVFPKDKYKH